jgi:hypothetical protein
MQVARELLDRRGVGVGVVAVDDTAIDESRFEGELLELCLRQSAADSGCP